MAFLGMRGTGDWAANQQPEDWRQTILYLYPNGKMPLTAIMSMMGSERTTDPTFHWWTQQLPEQGGAATEVYTTSGLSSAYTSGGTAGEVVYVKTTAAIAEEFRRGHNAQLGRTFTSPDGTVYGDHRYNIFGDVLSVVLNGASSYIALQLREADKTVDTVSAIANANRIDVVGNSNREGATMPDAIAYDPTERSNKTQIFRTPLSITRTAMLTTLRTPDAYKTAKRQALEMHGIEIEKAILWSMMSEIVVDGKRKRTTRGLVRAIDEFAPDEHIASFARDTNFSADTWIQSGQTWLDNKLELGFRYGATEKLGLIGSGALLGIQRLAQAGATLNISMDTASYGLKVGTWGTSFGDVFLKTHPLMSQNPALRHSIILFEPDRLRTRFVSDTFFKKDNSDKEVTNNSRDGREEEFLSELGLEHHHEMTGMILDGIGLDNAV